MSQDPTTDTRVGLKPVTSAEESFIDKTFGVHGSCACDGATDDGCPLCSPKKKVPFLGELRALVEKYR